MKQGPGHALIVLWALPFVVGCAGQVGVEPGSVVDTTSLTTHSVTLRTALHGNYVSAENGGGAIVVANRTQALAWETFTLYDLNSGTLADGDQVALAAMNGNFFSAENGGGSIVDANRTWIRDWEIFTVHRLGGGGNIASGDSISLQTKTLGLYWSADQGGGGGLTADRTAVQSWETFVLGLDGSAPPSSGAGSGTGASGPPTPPTTPLPTRLRVTSHCAAPIWIAHSDNVTDAQNIQLGNGQSHDYAIPAGGLSAARFWPKVGCDGSGHNCAMGDNGEGGGKPCPASGCQPPLDSKFEVSFASAGSTTPTYYNLSQVDGYTLPFKVNPHGVGAESGSCVTSDCSQLSLDRCPGAENMSGGGAFPAYASEDLRVRDASGKVIACMAPCKKWNYPAPYGLGKAENADPGLHLCCPTPIDPSTGQCTVANGCMTADACRAPGDPASVVHTSYVAAIRSMCPSAYSYAYDDAAGLHACSSNTSFEVTFCP